MEGGTPLNLTGKGHTGEKVCGNFLIKPSYF